MRILFTRTSYLPATSAGGTVVTAHELARHIAALGHRVVVYTTNADGLRTMNVPTDRPVEMDGVAIRYFACSQARMPWPLSAMPYFSQSFGYGYSRAMGEAIRSTIGEFDLAHLQSPFCYANLATARPALRAGVPYFYHSRGMLQPSHLQHRRAKKSAYLALFEKRIVRRASGLFALTADEARAFRRLGANGPIHIIPNGIDPDQFTAEVEDPSLPLIARLAGRTVILFMSRIHPTKGLDLLMPAFVQVAERHPDAALVVAGPDETGLVPKLEAEAARAALADRVIFPGLVEGTLKRNLLARADIFVLPSYMEGFSMCVLEAMAASVPVVVTHACHFPQAAEGGAGFVVEETCEAIAAALDRLLADGEVRRRMGEAGRRLVLERYRWRQVAEQTVAAYQQALDLKGGGPATA